MLTRRIFMATPAFMALAAGLPSKAQQMDVELHGLSYFGELALPPNFTHFAYVNPDAPKGGTISIAGSQWSFNQSVDTFNSFNTFILRGEAPYNMDRIFASLMVGHLDEPASYYGFAARSVMISEGGRVLTFRLRPEAVFHDGSPLTAEDVAWTLSTFKAEGHPTLRMILADMEKAEAMDDGRLKVTLAAGAPREVRFTIASMPILSKAYYATRSFGATTLEPPLGSGSYKIGRFEPGRFVEYERVKNWWGETLPVNRGGDNFDIIRAEFFRDRDVAFEAFKAGSYTFREEFTARIWATQYDFPAARSGRVKKVAIETDTVAPFQGFYFNTRRDSFKDARVREAIMQALDFEWINQNIMHGSAARTVSFFDASPLKATGKPSEAELALLEPLRGKVPAEVFGEPWVPPVSDGSGQDRALLRRATQLLREAGFTFRDGRLVNAAGTGLNLEILMDESGLDPHLAPFLANLKRLGIDATLRHVDAAQYQSRVKERDFDMISRGFVGSLTPGDSLRLLFGSEAAQMAGGLNYAGIADPAVDALINAVAQAKSREDLTVAAQALDRVLRAGRYIMPAWHRQARWFAYWDMYERPERRPLYGTGAFDTWWARP